MRSAGLFCLTMAVVFLLAPGNVMGSGSVVAWGDNDWGQCNVPLPNSGFQAISAGAGHSLGLKTDGSIVAWGRNNNGQCNVPEPNSGFVEVSAGVYHSLGLKADGTIVAWGWNSDGQGVPPSPNAGFTSISAAVRHNLALKTDGSVVAWGSNDYGQLNIPQPNSGFAAVAACTEHSLGLKTDGSIVAWGRNSHGQCDVPEPNTGFVAVAAGVNVSLGLKSDGSVAVWGQLYPPDVPSPNTGFVAIEAGQYHRLALKSDGSIVRFGSSPQNLPVPNTGFTAVSAGYLHSLGLKTSIPSSSSLQSASLRVTILPPQAVADEARWRRAGTTVWKKSGETEHGVPVGIYLIEFEDLHLWVGLPQLAYVSPLGTDVVLIGYRADWISEVKGVPDGTPVRLIDTVTAAWDDVFYIESLDRSSGIRVESANHKLREGDMVHIVGALGTTTDHERFINPFRIEPAGSGSIEPIGLIGRALGGGDFIGPVPSGGQAGVIGGYGLNNIGLLIRTWGEVTQIGDDYLYIDDGSRLRDRTFTDDEENIGVRVIVDPEAYVRGDYLVVTGVSSCFATKYGPARRVLIRTKDDIVSYVGWAGSQYPW